MREADAGVVVFKRGKPVRRPEADLAERAFRRLGIPILHRMAGEGTAEGGDLLWVDRDVALVGRSYRTNAAGVAKLSDVLGRVGVTGFASLGCNVLALAPRHCLVVAGNPRVRVELERRGARVEEFPDRELGLNMGGGPTCLVQAVLREY